MESSHPIRHRVGIVLVCLVALFTARDGWIVRDNRPLAKSLPAIKPGIERRHATESNPTDPIVERQSFGGSLLRPMWALPGTDDLPCCDLVSDPLAETDPYYVFALNPDTFPLSAQFVPAAVPTESATINLTLLEKAEKIEPLQPDSYALWLPPLSKCSNVKKDPQGKEYCAPEEVTQVPEPAGVMLAISGAAALAVKLRRLK